MNVPNILTTARIFLTFLFIYFLLQSGLIAKSIALAIFILASITDYFDGYLARKYNLITTYGKIMDPIADKFLTLSAFFMLSNLGFFPLWMVIIIFIREIGITVLRFMAMRYNQVLAAEKSGKYKTVIQIVTIIWGLIFAVLYQTSLMTRTSFGICLAVTLILMIITCLITVSSGISFLMNNRNVRYV